MVNGESNHQPILVCKCRVDFFSRGEVQFFQKEVFGSMYFYFLGCISVTS